jgi:hypothetical protein
LLRIKSLSKITLWESVISFAADLVELETLKLEAAILKVPPDFGVAAKTVVKPPSSRRVYNEHRECFPYISGPL